MNQAFFSSFFYRKNIKTRTKTIQFFYNEHGSIGQKLLVRAVQALQKQVLLLTLVRLCSSSKSEQPGTRCASFIWLQPSHSSVKGLFRRHWHIDIFIDFFFFQNPFSYDYKTALHEGKRVLVRPSDLSCSCQPGINPLTITLPLQYINKCL